MADQPSRARPTRSQSPADLALPMLSVHGAQPTGSPRRSRLMRSRARLARDRSVSPWLLLDQLAARQAALPSLAAAMSPRAPASTPGQRDAAGIGRQHRAGAGWMTAR